MSRELLQEALEALDVLLAQRSGASWMQERADRIRAELARTEWVKFADALPVVSEGKRWVSIWRFQEGLHKHPYIASWLASYNLTDASDDEYWQPLVIPQPPRSEA